MTGDVAALLDRPARHGHTGAMLAIERPIPAIVAATITLIAMAGRDGAAPFFCHGRGGRASVIEEAQRMPLIVLQNAL